MKQVKSTRVVIVALTDKGKDALLIQKNDEIALRFKYKGVSRWKVPLRLHSYLKSVSLFAPKGGCPSRHELLGFSRMNEFHKTAFYMGVKDAFLTNGCSVDDFEVKFYDE